MSTYKSNKKCPPKGSSSKPNLKFTILIGQLSQDLELSESEDWRGEKRGSTQWGFFDFRRSEVVGVSERREFASVADRGEIAEERAAAVAAESVPLEPDGRISEVRRMAPGAAKLIGEAAAQLGRWLGRRCA